VKGDVRIDVLLVVRELAESREKAQAMILAGQVLADEQKVDKPGRKVSPQADLRLLGQQPKFVSRAGFKLEAALDAFAIDVAGRTCLDVGSSTGGFSDCLLQRGAAKVYAVDVGTNQLHWRIRRDPRVVSLERVNARRLSSGEVPEECGFGCCDVSFISVTLILPALIGRLSREADLVVLVKPQFEAGRGQVGKGGIVRDETIRQAAVEKVRQQLGELGFQRVEAMPSPILGAEGNQEFLLFASERA
jgi:23S rRNA (cytidine1920-2'-O)/16S rRNA (cytidine1409-2'-O)-methyltransferase